MVKGSDFKADVRLPPGLIIPHIRKSIEYIERELGAFADIYLEQQNVFSALVGIFGAKALDSFSVYEKRKHTALAQTRFPDLKRRGSAEPPRPEESLESKGSKRPWVLQAHYDHAGWYIVWRYLVDPTESIEAGKTVIIWRVDVAFLTKQDWKYEASKAGALGGGRTHTYGLKNPRSVFKDKGVYQRSDRPPWARSSLVNAPISFFLTPIRSKNISNTQRIKGVILAGKYLDRLPWGKHQNGKIVRGADLGSP